jgi:hypothetical protein
MTAQLRKNFCAAHQPGDFKHPIIARAEDVIG